MAKRDSNFNPTGKGRRLRRNSPGVADWDTVDGQIVIRAIAAAARAGGALRFGYSRDGGAYSIGVYGDGDPYTEYVSPHESPEDLLKDITEMFDDDNHEQQKQKTPK